MENYLLSLVGPGSIKSHFESIGLKYNKVLAEIRRIADALCSSDIGGIVLLPDEGIAFEIAKFFKKFTVFRKKNQKVIGLLPSSDENFGIKHLTKTINAYVDIGRTKSNVFDSFIDLPDWFLVNQNQIIYGDGCLYLGHSPGAMLEVAGGLYMFKIYKGLKPGVEQNVKNKGWYNLLRLHNWPRVVFVYEPFIKDKFPRDFEAYFAKYEMILNYVKDSSELKDLLNKLIQQAQKFSC